MLRGLAALAFVAATLPEPPTAGWTAYGAWEWRAREAATGRVWERRQDGLEEIVLDEAKPEMVLREKRLFQAGMYTCTMHQSQCNGFASKVWVWRKKLVIVTNEWDVESLSDEQQAWLEKNTVVLNLYEEGVPEQMWVDSDEEDDEDGRPDYDPPPAARDEAAAAADDEELERMLQVEELLEYGP